MTADPSSCPICIEDYKGKKVQKVTCQYCPSHACRGCQQRYLLQSYEDPHCMECKRGWSTEFMSANFPLVFRNDTLRKHRRKVLFEREKAMLPAMQVYVEYKREANEAWRQAKELEKTVGNPYNLDPERHRETLAWKAKEAQKVFVAAERKLQLVRHNIAQVRDEMAAGAEPTWNLATLRATRTQLKEQIPPLKEAHEAARDAFQQADHVMQTFYQAYYRASANYDDRGGGGANAPARERREFIMRCPAEDCRGFLSSAYKCGTCAKWTCRDCLVCIGDDKDAAHTCDKDTVESAKAIKAETRPCPKCGTRIFKIDGCDQMWCVMDGCHTAFSWNSGHVVTGVVHNPHYYEWLRRNGGGAAPREAGDIPCGGLPGNWQFVNFITRNAFFSNDQRQYLMNVHRSIADLIHVRLPEYPARMPAGYNKDNDVAYLMNTLTEDEWKRQLELAEARFIRKKEIGQILQTLATAGSDMLNRFMVHGASFGNGTQMLRWYRESFEPELRGLLTFTNEALKALAKREHQAVPQFDEKTWHWMPTRALYRKGPTAAQKRKAAALEAAQAAELLRAQGAGAAVAAVAGGAAAVADEPPPLVDADATA